MKLSNEDFYGERGRMGAGEISFRDAQEMIFGDQEIMLYLTGVILLLTFTLMVIGIIIKSLRRKRK